MHRIFLPIYKFFGKHKTLMYLTMVLSFVLFAFFASKIRLEEDIVKLLPRSSTQNELAFTEIELKDKIFIQFTSSDAANPLDSETLGTIARDYCERLQEWDSTGTYIKGILHSLDSDLALGAMDYGLDHLPTLIDPSWYPEIEKALTPQAIDASMADNYRLIMEDETGDDTQLAAMDPLHLRDVALGIFAGDGEGLGGLTIEGGHIFCPDKTVAMAYLTPNFSSTDSGTSSKLVKQMKRLGRQIEKEYPGSHVLMHGNVPGSVSNAGTIKKDLVFTIGISLLLILVIVLASFHKMAFVWQQVVPIIYGTVFSLACMYWIKGYMSLMALGIGAIVLGVAISYCLHVLIHYYYVGDVEKMLREESTPVFLGCVTTIGAFMGLLFTESDLLRDFGLFATFALAGNTLFALIFLPHFMSLKQIKFRKEHGFPLVERINSLPWDRNKWVIAIMVVIIAVGVAFSPRVGFDSDLINLDYRNKELVESQELYNAKNADGFQHQYFAAWSDNLDDALSYNTRLAARIDQLIEDGTAKDYSNLAATLFLPRDAQQQRINAWNAFWSPERVRNLKRDLAESARKNGLDPDMFSGFTSLLEQDYEPGDLYAAGVIPAGLLSNFIEKQASGRYMVFTDVSYPAESKDKVWKELTQVENVIVLEPFYYCRDMVEIVHDDFSTTLWISSLFVFLVLLISFRNLWVALIAFMPMFISWYVMQGYMAILGLEFNLINIVISTFIYGIGVDYSIFVMEGLLKEARTGQKDMLSFHKVAIFYSALVLGIVTASLIFAQHPAISSIGLITLIGMASTILITYSLEPWVFRKLAKIPYFKRSFRINL